MILDTSALIATILAETEEKAIRLALGESSRTEMSVANYLEAQITLRHKRPDFAGVALVRLLERLRIELVEVDRVQIDMAVKANAIYGKGAGHPARLNFGDCFA